MLSTSSAMRMRSPFGELWLCDRAGRSPWGRIAAVAVGCACAPNMRSASRRSHSVVGHEGLQLVGRTLLSMKASVFRSSFVSGRRSHLDGRQLVSGWRSHLDEMQLAQPTSRLQEPGNATLENGSSTSCGYFFRTASYGNTVPAIA